MNRKENKTTMGAKNAKNPNPHDCGILLSLKDPKCEDFRNAKEKKERLQKEKEAKKSAQYDTPKEIEKRRKKRLQHWNNPGTFRGPG